MSHHSQDDPTMPLHMQELMKALRTQQNNIDGDFPDGKLTPHDEGALAVAVGTKDRSVILQFPKPIEWIGFTPDQALDLAQNLITKARHLGCTKPFTLTL